MLVHHTSRDCAESCVKYSRAVHHPRVLDVQSVPRRVPKEERGDAARSCLCLAEDALYLCSLVKTTLGLDRMCESPGEDSSQMWEKRLG